MIVNYKANLNKNIHSIHKNKPFVVEFTKYNLFGSKLQNSECYEYYCTESKANKVIEHFNKFN